MVLQQKYEFQSRPDTRYLGIVIEKDSEYSAKFCAEETVKREYISTRQAYMDITKLCKKTMDKCEKKGGCS